MKLADCKNLEDLGELLIRLAEREEGATERIGQRTPLVEWTALPTFGGPEPDDTAGVWSWDRTRLLVGTCAGDLRIRPRADEDDD